MSKQPERLAADDPIPAAHRTPRHPADECSSLDAVTAVGQRDPVALLHVLATADTGSRSRVMRALQAVAGNAELQRRVTSAQHARPAGPLLQRSTRVERVYRKFIREMQSHGLPVRFLRKVERDVPIDLGTSIDAYRDNQLFLTDETLTEVEEMELGNATGGSRAIQTIYHEATHAYLDLMKDHPRFRRFMARGERHYEGAPLAGGEVADDPWRVFQEAAASYVGHRVSAWWLAYDTLAIRIQRHRLTDRVLGQIRRDYDAAMAERVFGYEYEGGFLGIGDEQVETTRPMTTEMKTFLDRELLENKIPERFDAVPFFATMISLRE